MNQPRKAGFINNLTDAQFIHVFELRANDTKLQDIADIYGVSDATICKILYDSSERRKKAGVPIRLAEKVMSMKVKRKKPSTNGESAPPEKTEPAPEPKEAQPDLPLEIADSAVMDQMAFEYHTALIKQRQQYRTYIHQVREVNKMSQAYLNYGFSQKWLDNMNDLILLMDKDYE